MLPQHSGFSSTLLLRGTDGGIIPTLQKRVVFVRYWEDSKEMQVEADPMEIGIVGYNRLVPIPPALLPDKDRDFGPDENNAEIAIISAQEGLVALQCTLTVQQAILCFSVLLYRCGIWNVLVLSMRHQ